MLKKWKYIIETKKRQNKTKSKKWNKNTYIKEKMKNSTIAQPETNKIKWSVDK